MSRPLPKWIVALIQGVLVSITVAVILTTFFVTLPALETRYWPVVKKLEILSVERATEDRSIVYGQFNKVRQCSYIGIAWFQRNVNGVLERVPVETRRRPGDNSSPDRPIGVQAAGPWIVDIPINDLRGTSVVELTHRCHPFWTTVTHFYP